jgi:ribosomal protein S1
LSELEGISEDKLSEAYKGGEELELKIIEIDSANRRIALSQKILKSSQAAEEMKAYLKKDAESGTAFGDALKEAISENKGTPEA